jgi:ribosomal peptide maturation radical SAM protein 1
VGLPDVVFISMPFGPVMAPSIGLSLLKSGLARRGIASEIRYFSIRFAELVGWSLYAGIANGTGPSLQELAGEWIFNGALFGITRDDEQRYIDEILIRRAAWARPMPRIDARMVERISRARSRVETFLDWCLERVIEAEPRIVGFTSTFQQHVASLALARRIRERRPDVSIIFGGANCEGAMGAETVRQFPFVDAAVSGEGDLVVPELVERLLERRPLEGLSGVRTPKEVQAQPPPPFWSGAPIVHDLDSLPTPDYSDFFEQFRTSRFARSWQPALFFESSRGCWWGETSHCTFCGLNGTTMTFRSKSARRALEEIVGLTQAWPGSDIQVVDNILDMKYFDDLIPELAKMRLNLALFYETKSNLRKEQVLKLRNAGIVRIQPGIESFSDSVLRLMRKGVSGLQNIQLLKWCKELGLEPYWNLIWGFPGEVADEYRRMADLVPYLAHLPPPVSSAGLRLDRFSPNFERASELGFADVRPLAPYGHIYPIPEESLRNLAYYFSYRHQDGRTPESYVGPLLRGLKSWQSSALEADLFSVDLDNLLLIFDLRPGAERFLTALSGLDRVIYLAADAITDARTLSDSYSESQDDMIGRMAPMVDRGLMLRDGQRYLALAIPVGSYQPGPRARARFRTAIRKVGKRVPGGTRIELPHPVALPEYRAARQQRSPRGAIHPSLFLVENDRTILVRDSR